MTQMQTRYDVGNAGDDGVQVRVQVQAPEGELADLVAVVTARLEGAGLAVVARSAPAEGSVEVVLTRAAWLGDSPLP